MPIGGVTCFFDGFTIILICSVYFVLIATATSVLANVLSNCVPFSDRDILCLLQGYVRVSLLATFTILPMLTITTTRGNCVLPIYLALVCAFLNFVLLVIGVCLRPLSDVATVIVCSVPNIMFSRPLGVPTTFLYVNM